MMVLLSSHYHSTEMVALLLRRGADPSSCNEEEQSSLHYCIRYSNFGGCLNKLILLINAAANVHALDCWGNSVTEYAYHTPVERYSSRRYGNKTGNRGKIWQEALTACGYDAAEICQVYFDAGGRIRGQHGDWKLDSDSEDYSVDSSDLSVGSEADEEEFHSTNFAEQPPSHNQDQNSNLGYPELSTSAPEPMDDQRFPTVLPPSHHPFGSTDIWQVQPSTTGFVTELPENEYFQPSFDTSSRSVDPTPTTEESRTDEHPWAWSHAGQNYGHISQDPRASMPYPLDPQSQHGVPQRSYNASAHKSSAQLANAWLQTQDYSLLEADANIWNE